MFGYALLTIVIDTPIKINKTMDRYKCRLRLGYEYKDHIFSENGAEMRYVKIHMTINTHSWRTVRKTSEIIVHSHKSVT